MGSSVSSNPHFRIPILAKADMLVSSLAVPLLHPTLLPVPVLTLIHGLRVSYATCQAQGGPRNVPLPQSIALIWLLLFGGWVLLCVALAQPCPLLEPGVQWTALVYACIHSFAVLSGLQSLIQTAVAKYPDSLGLALDLLYNLVDAICRADGIVSLGIEPVRGHASFFTPLLTSAMIGGGGLLLIGLLNLDGPDWRLQMPTWLKDPSGLLAIDIWSASLVGLVYRATTEAVLPGETFPQGVFGPATLKEQTAAFTTGRALLSRTEARLLGSIVLFTLLTVNRLRASVITQRPFATLTHGSGNDFQSIGRGSHKKRKNSTAARQGSAQKSSTMSPLLWIGLLVPIGLLVAQIMLSGSDIETVLSGLKLDANILFLLAHPDDEVMFFSPLITALLTVVPASNLFGISVSVGSAGGDDGGNLGRTRAKELVDAYGFFGVPSGNVIAIDDTLLRDGMHESWQTDAIVQAVDTAVGEQGGWPARFDAVVTFDDGGISGHPNHISVARSATAVAALFKGPSPGEILLDKAPSIWRLRSLPMYRKYGSLPYALFARIAAPFQSQATRYCSFTLSSPAGYVRAAQAMRAHASQLVWFRYGWWISSSYVFGSEVCRDGG